jgi:hypothetical protein
VWPWTPLDSARDVTFARILEEVRMAGRILSLRELADRLSTSRMTVQRAVDANRAQWEVECGAF